MQRSAYGALGQVATPLGDANHKRYGVRTTPTLVLVDRKGIVRLYNPGQLPADTLEPLVARLLAES